MFKRTLVLLLGLMLTAPAMAAGHYRGGYGGHFHYGHHGGDAGGALVAGLVFGGLLGYLISENQQSRNDVYWSNPDQAYYYPGYDYDYGYPRYVRVVPVPVPSRVVTENPEFAGENCQMTREYTATIEVDGKKHDAYGTKCLTPDGEWILGRPKLVPKFD